MISNTEQSRMAWLTRREGEGRGGEGRRGEGVKCSCHLTQLVCLAHTVVGVPVSVRHPLSQCCPPCGGQESLLCGRDGYRGGDMHTHWMCVHVFVQRKITHRSNSTNLGQIPASTTAWMRWLGPSARKDHAQHRSCSNSSSFSSYIHFFISSNRGSI